MRSQRRQQNHAAALAHDRQQLLRVGDENVQSAAYDGPDPFRQR
jgi:hypothetical protein